MRFARPTVGIAALTSLTQAFPAGLVDKLASEPKIQARASAILQARSNENGDAPTLPEAFSEKQLIDVTGEHAWKAPGPNDLRGPCPGLNAFANHGFIPRSGYATITQFIEATTSVVGMGILLSTFLAVLGAAIDGDGLAWSIGGTPDAEILNLSSIGLGPGNGLSGSHNKYESDASPTRPDLYQEGNNYRIKIDQFQALVDMADDPETANFNIPLLTDFRSKRFDQQIASNPYFFNGPFTGVLVQPAAYTFIYRFMANHSAEAPYGTLSTDVLKSWFAISGESGAYQWTEGHERIPDNWYRRDYLQPYESTYFLLDLVYSVLKYPKFLDIGGNTGTTNSFTGVDIANFTGGIIHGEDLLEGDKFACLAYQAAAQASPDVALLHTANLFSAVGDLIGPLECPELGKLDEEQLKSFPGYNTN